MLKDEDLPGKVQRKPLLQSFIRSTKAFHMMALIPQLQAVGAHNALAVTLNYAGKVKEALAIWRDLGTGLLDDPPGDGKEDSVQLLESLPLESDKTLEGLIWEFTPWLLTKDPPRALRIFTGTQSSHLPPEAVIPFFEAKAPAAVLPYLEWLVNKAGSKVAPPSSSPSSSPSSFLCSNCSNGISVVDCTTHRNQNTTHNWH
jgi:hypothetical protein